MFKKFLLFTILLLLALPLGSRAFQETSVGNNLLAEVKPNSPAPGELTTISLSGYGFDLDSSTISWSVNGQLKLQDLGRKTFSFNLGPVGERTKVEVLVKTFSGRQFSKTFIFDPAEIEVFWETQTSKPLFYQGKAQPSAGAKLHLVAFPYLVNRAGQKIDPAKLNYHWKKDGALIEDLSGLGKNSAIINTTAKDSSAKIEVEVISLADKISASKSLVINLIKPEIVFYEKKPLEGTNYGQVLPAEYSLFENEVAVRAEPYWLPLESNLIFKYLWTIDRSSAEGRPEDPLTINLRRNEGISGSNRISFSAQGPDSTISNSFTIKYGNGLLRPQI